MVPKCDILSSPWGALLGPAALNIRLFLQLIMVPTATVSLPTEILRFAFMPMKLILPQRPTKNIRVLVRLLIHKNLCSGAFAFYIAIAGLLPIPVLRNPCTSVGSMREPVRRKPLPTLQRPAGTVETKPILHRW